VPCSSPHSAAPSVREASSMAMADRSRLFHRSYLHAGVAGNRVRRCPLRPLTPLGATMTDSDGQPEPRLAAEGEEPLLGEYPPFELTTISADDVARMPNKRPGPVTLQDCQARIRECHGCRHREQPAGLTRSLSPLYLGRPYASRRPLLGTLLALSCLGCPALAVLLSVVKSFGPTVFMNFGPGGTSCGSHWAGRVRRLLSGSVGRCPCSGAEGVGSR
jgi:hypothetical protein